MSPCGIATSFLLLFIAVFSSDANSERQKRCGNELCSVVLFEAKALKDSPPSHPQFLSFGAGEIVNVYAVGLTDRPDLWEGEINGSRGLFYLNFVSHEGFHKFVQKSVWESKLLMVMGDGNTLLNVEDATTTFAKFKHLWMDPIPNDPIVPTPSQLPTAQHPAVPPKNVEVIKDQSDVPIAADSVLKSAVPVEKVAATPEINVKMTADPVDIKPIDGASVQHIADPKPNVPAKEQFVPAAAAVPIPAEVATPPVAAQQHQQPIVPPVQIPTIPQLNDPGMERSAVNSVPKETVVEPTVQTPTENVVPTQIPVEKVAATIRIPSETVVTTPKPTERVVVPTTQVPTDSVQSTQQIPVEKAVPTVTTPIEPPVVPAQIPSHPETVNIPPTPAVKMDVSGSLPADPVPKAAEPIVVATTTPPPLPVEIPLVTPMPTVPPAIHPAVVETTLPPAATHQPYVQQSNQQIPPVASTPPPIDINWTPPPMAEQVVFTQQPVGQPPVPQQQLNHPPPESYHQGHSHEHGHSHDANEHSHQHINDANEHGHGHSHSSGEEGHHGHSHSSVGFGRHQFKREGGKIVIPKADEIPLPTPVEPQPKGVEVVDQFGQSYCEKGQPCDNQVVKPMEDAKFQPNGQAILTELNPMKELTPEATVQPHYEPINFETNPPPPPPKTDGFGQKFAAVVNAVWTGIRRILGVFKQLAQQIHSWLPHRYKEVCDERDTFCFCMTSALVAVYLVVRLLETSAHSSGAQKAFNMARLAEKLQTAEMENEKLRNLSQTSADSVKNLQVEQRQRQQLESHLKQLEAENKSLKDQFDQVNRSNESLRSNCDQYEQVMAAHKQIVVDLETKIRSAMSDNEDLKHHKTTWISQEKSLNTELKELRDVLNDRSSEIDHLKKSLHDAEVKIKELQRHSDEAAQMRLATETELQSKLELIEFRDKEIVGLQQTIARLHEAVEVSSSGVGEMDETDGNESGWEIEELSNANETVAKRTVQERLDKVMDVAKLHADLKDLENEKRKVESMLKSEVKQKCEVEAKLITLQQQLDKVNAERSGFEQKISDSETKFAIMTDYFKSQEAELKKQLITQDQMLTENRIKLASDEEELKHLKLEVESLKEKLQQQKAEMDENDRKSREFQSNLQKQNGEFYDEMKRSRKERDDAIKERNKWRQNYAAEVRKNSGGVGMADLINGDSNSENEITSTLQRSATSPPGTGGLLSPDLALMGMPVHPDLLFGPPPMRSRPNSFYGGDRLFVSDYSGDDSYSRRSFRRDKSRGRGDLDEFQGGGEELNERGRGYYAAPQQPHRQRSRSHGRSLYGHPPGSSSNDENIYSPPPSRFALPAIPPPEAIDPLRHNRQTGRRSVDPSKHRQSEIEANRGGPSRNDRDPML